MSANPSPARDDALLDPEAILHTVVRYLLAKGHKEPARHLAMARVEFVLTKHDILGFHQVSATITIAGGPLTFDYFSRLINARDDFAEDAAEREDHATCSTLQTAFQYALPSGITFGGLERRLLVTEIADDWRADVLRELDGQGGHNQGLAPADEEIITWRNLRFRSFSEMKIAEAFDRAGVMFFPNCRGRLGLQKRGNLEPDFLVCHKGDWGILEVDGEPFHQPTRTVHDHERDRAFLRHRVKIAQHYDATRCRTDPDGVVAEFLALLEG
jgi:hypothetical protein